MRFASWKSSRKHWELYNMKKHLILHWKGKKNGTSFLDEELPARVQWLIIKTNCSLSSYRPKLPLVAAQHKQLPLSSTEDSADVFRLVVSREFMGGY